MGKKHKKHKTKSKSIETSSSESDVSLEEVWVEKGYCTNQSEVKEKVEHNEWLSVLSHFPSVSREKICREKTMKNENIEKEKYMLDKLGQTDRELNPYWKDGGSGLPAEKSQINVTSLSKTSVGDQGVHWLKKALQRAREQAKEQGRKLDDVVAERWGSLADLETKIANAEKRESEYKQQEDERRQPRKRNDRHLGSKYRIEQDNHKEKQREATDTNSSNKDHNDKHERAEKHREDKYYKKYDKDKESAGRDREKDRYKKHKYDNKYSNSRVNADKCRNKEQERYKDEKYKRESSKQFLIPVEDESLQSNTTQQQTFALSHSKGWKKKEFKECVEKITVTEPIDTNSRPADAISTNESSISERVQILSDKEMNELASKVMKAEIMGNSVLASELQMKLDAARKLKSNNLQEMKSINEIEETVILTKTDAKGFTQPLTFEGSHLEPSGGRRKGQKIETHKDGKRMRYFADDDKYSLQDMFQREKLNTVEDQSEVFLKLVSKGIGKEESTRDMDDLFDETVCVKESEGKIQRKARERAIIEHKRTERVLDSCEWCLDSKILLRHLVVAIGKKCYLCLPPFRSLTDGHCLIVPTVHTPCATMIDEDVWDEIQNFRKSVTKMFKEENNDVVFFECAIYLRKMPHMVLHCVPVPKETGDLAPIYFKKAILECEMEWATNKKLIDLSGKDVRRGVPKGLPYFAVDFGLQSGFAHVIEDERLFPQNFAQEIIGGMLDLDHALWRKPKKEKLEEQTKKVIRFTKLWKPFDCTKNNN